MTSNSSKTEKFRKYREHLDQQIILLGDKYNLPKLSGAEKQVAWAADIRIRFVEYFDKNKDALPDTASHCVETLIFTQTESRWWIDRRDQSYEDILSFATTVSLVNKQEGKLPGYQKKNNVVFINAENERIFVSYFEPENISSIMMRHSFELEDKNWVREIPLKDVTRQGILDSICLALLSAGFAAKIQHPPKPEAIHDGILKIINGKLCLETRTEAVYKAASRVGKRHIWFDGVDKSEIQKLISAYDIGISEEARTRLGGINV